MSTVLEAPPETAPIPSTAATLSPVSERLVALDVFRGATIAGMLLVNNPGGGDSYTPLDHAPWNGWTPTDLIFPFFLFIVGVTTYLSLRKRKPDEIVPKILRRGALIFLTGLLLNWFPYFWWSKIAGNPNPSFWDRVVYRWDHLRYLGVLQRIGIAYTIAALVAVKTTRKQLMIIASAILIGYWMILMLVPVPGTGMIGAMTINDPAHTLEA